MSQAVSFCRQCGRPINSGILFCPYCGAPTTAANPGGQGYPAAPVPQQYSAVAAKPARRRPLILLILVGLLLFIVALRGPVALLFGVSTTGVIQSVRQVIDGSSERMDYNYSITYAFTSSDGKSHTGSYDMNRVYNSANLPAEGTLLTVKYLPGFAYVNSVSGRGNVGLSSIIMLVLGVALFVIGLKGSIKLSIGKSGR